MRLFNFFVKNMTYLNPSNDIILKTVIKVDNKI